MMDMERTTITADERLLDEVRELARRDGVSFAEVVRRALEGYVVQRRARPSFVAAGASAEPCDIGRRAGEMEYEPRSWR